MPLEKQMWGDEFGQVIDRFGISWMVNITEAQQTARRWPSQGAGLGSLRE